MNSAKLLLVTLAATAAAACGSANGTGGNGGSTSSSTSSSSSGSSTGSSSGQATSSSSTSSSGSGGAPSSSGTGGSSSSGSIDGILPPDRTMDWTVAGVPGGIPSVTTICATVSPGNADDASTIQSAIEACPAGQAVHVTAGTYTLNSPIVDNTSGVVVRGDGPGKTVWKVPSGSGFKMGTAADWPPPQVKAPVLSGATKGSTQITLDATGDTADHPAFQVGGLMRIGAGKNPPFVKNIGVSSYDEALALTFRVTAVTATTVTFEPPLPLDLSAWSPQATAFAIPPLTSAGLEDLTIDLGGTGTYGVEISQAWGSWVKNVEILGSAAHTLTLYTVLNSEIRHCNLHDAASSGPDTEGLDFYRDVDWNLIEDNIVAHSGGVVLGDWQGGDAGNVIAYNFLYDTPTPDPTVAGYDVDLSHGSNVVLNLLEGNVIGQIIADGYFGSTSHGTLYRNWITATHPTAKNNLAAVKLKHFSDYFNLVGNVLGTSAFPAQGNIQGGFAYGGFYEAPMMSGYDDGWSTGVQVLYELGFPNMGNTGYSGTVPASDPVDYGSQGADLASAQALDLNVAATMLRHGNYDYSHKAIVWDAKIAQKTLPESLYRKGKPTWFGKLAWPPFDPSAPPGAFDPAKIPAGYRYANGGQEP